MKVKGGIRILQYVLQFRYLTKSAPPHLYFPSDPLSNCGACSAIVRLIHNLHQHHHIMSDDAEDFESINLASVAIDTKPLSLLGAVPESSDDGLDPNDFLTQNQTEQPEESVYLEKNGTDTTVPNDERSGSLLTSHLYESTLRESMSPSVFRPDDLLAYDTESGWQTRQENELLLRYLLDKLESLKSDMKRDLQIHKEFLAEGSDCKQIRDIIGDRFLQMSENHYSLNEIYNKESSMLRGFLQHLERWDSRRSKILNRVKSIKSDGHNFGVKLADLLRKRNDIDTEIEELESRLKVLRDNKVVVENEIDEASSVLESKSAKYVNLFRELEKQGERVITGFLLSSGLPQKDLQVLLRRNPVKAAFRYKAQESEQSKQKLVPKMPLKEASKTPPESNPTSVQAQPPPQTMGAQAFEVNDEELPNFSELTAYEKGFEKGNEQLAKVKKTVSTIMEAIFKSQEQTKAHNESVDDQLNMITDMIDLDPIIELLSYRIGASEDLSVVSSKLSAQLHHDGEAWRSISAALNGKESRLLELLSHSNKMTREVQDLLQSSYDTLKHFWEETKKDSAGKNLPRYLQILLNRELKAIASALDSISGDSSFISKVPSLGSSADEDALNIDEPTRPLRFKMTNQGYKPTPLTVVDTSTENAAGKSSLNSPQFYDKSMKDFKNE